MIVCQSRELRLCRVFSRSVTELHHMVNFVAPVKGQYYTIYLFARNGVGAIVSDSRARDFREDIGQGGGAAHVAKAACGKTSRSGPLGNIFAADCGPALATES